MVRLVSLSIPVNKKGDVTAILDPLANKRVFHLVTLATDDTVQMTFKCRDKHLQDVLEELGNIGCGKWFGTVDAMIVAVSRPSISSVLSVEGKKREYKINTRMTIDEIDSIVDDGNHLTFNYMMQLTMASIMAGTGMVTNSSVSVLASMLVSPLMGPVLSMAFGMAVNDMAVIKRGLRNEIVGVTIGLVTGIVMGFFSSFLYPSDYRSDEMTSRGSGTLSHFSLFSKPVRLPALSRSSIFLVASPYSSVLLFNDASPELDFWMHHCWRFGSVCGDRGVHGRMECRCRRCHFHFSPAADCECQHVLDYGFDVLDYVQRRS